MSSLNPCHVITHYIIYYITIYRIIITYYIIIDVKLLIGRVSVLIVLMAETLSSREVKMWRTEKHFIRSE